MATIDATAPEWAKRFADDVNRDLEAVRGRSRRPFRLPSFTVANMPDARDWPACIVFVSDGAGNKWLAASNGTSWRYADGSAV